MSFKYKALLIITPLVFFLDQLTKWLVMKSIPFHGSIPVMSGYFDIVFLRNTGAAFGMFADMGEGIRNIFFYIVAMIAIIVLTAIYARLSHEARLLPIAISLVFGGIAGNFLDRIRFGAVTDFLSVHIRDVAIEWTMFGRNIHMPLDWPAFNVADSAITVAMVLFIISAFRQDRRET